MNPSPRLQTLVSALTPPASREHVLGDLFERVAHEPATRVNRAYLREAASLLPWIVWSELRNAVGLKAVLGQTALIFTAFVCAVTMSITGDASGFLLSNAGLAQNRHSGPRRGAGHDRAGNLRPEALDANRADGPDSARLRRRGPRAARVRPGGTGLDAASPDLRVGRDLHTDLSAHRAVLFSARPARVAVSSRGSPNRIPRVRARHSPADSVGVLCGVAATVACAGLAFVARSNLERVSAILSSLAGAYVLMQCVAYRLHFPPTDGSGQGLTREQFAEELRRQRRFHRGRLLWQRFFVALPGPLLLCWAQSFAHPGQRGAALLGGYRVAHTLDDVGAAQLGPGAPLRPRPRGAEHRPAVARSRHDTLLMNTLSSTAIPVRVDGISKRFDKTVALTDVSLEIHAGEIFGLVGPNGAGKTTLIRTILDIIKPDSGTVEVFGRPFSRRIAIGSAICRKNAAYIRARRSARCSNICGVLKGMTPATPARADRARGSSASS